MTARIIIIDDDVNLCALMRRWLVRAGMDVTVHTSPFGTLNVLRKGSFDLVILDINMPALNGPNIVRLMRETEGLEHMRILLCSLIEEDALRAIAREAGVKSFVTKSASQNEFVGAVLGALGGSPSL
jgi:two-component system, OmpR family, response regulator